MKRCAVCHVAEDIHKFYPSTFDHTFTYEHPPVGFDADTVNIAIIGPRSVNETLDIKTWHHDQEPDLNVICRVCGLIIEHPEECNMELYSIGWPVHVATVCERQLVGVWDAGVDRRYWEVW